MKRMNIRSRYADIRSLLLAAMLITFIPSQAINAMQEISPVAEAANDSIDIDTTDLDDLVVTASVPLVHSDGAKLTYNVTEDPEAKSSNTLDILRKVPGVTVDAQENVKVNGQSSFKIFLNGKEDPMLSGDIKTILKSMPASTIQKIEVISEPGAKYEAEGTGGILNIITTSRQTLEGYLANIGISAHNQGLGAYLYGRAKVRNVTANANFSFSDNFITAGNTNLSESETVNYEDTDQYRRLSNSESTNKGHYAGGGFNLSWEPDTLNLMTVGFNGYSSNWASTVSEKMSMADIADKKLWSLDRDYDTDYGVTGLSAQLSYQHTFGKREHTLVASYSFNHSDSDNNSYVHTGNITGNPDIDYIWSSNRNKDNSDSHILQIDYTNPFDSHHRLEAGGKANMRRSNSGRAPWYGDSREDMTLRESDHVEMRQLDDIAALYASYNGTYSSWTVRAGLRYEYTRRGIRYRIAPEGYNDFTNRFNDWVPDLSASYSFGSAQNVRAAYQMRISRPGLSILNPYRNTLTPGMVYYGNPDLKSEKSHNISLSYSNYANALTGMIKATYYFSRNSVTDVIFTSPDMPGVIQSSYANVGRYNNVSIDLNLNWRITNSFNIGMWLNERYVNLKAESELFSAAKTGWNTTLNASADYTFPFKLRLSAYGGYGSPWIDLQSKGSSWYYYSIGIGRSFLKEDRLTINASLNNLIPTHRNYHWQQESESAYMRSSSRYRQWSFGISVSWRLGGLNSDVKRTASRIEESATSDGSNSNKK